MDNQAQIPDLAELKRLADACPPAGNHHFESDEWKAVKAFRDEVVRLFGCDVGMAKALTSEIQELCKEAERYRWLQQWYIEGRSRSEINPWGHIMITTPLVMDACIDAAMGNGWQS